MDILPEFCYLSSCHSVVHVIEIETFEETVGIVRDVASCSSRSGYDNGERWATLCDPVIIKTSWARRLS